LLSPPGRAGVGIAAMNGSMDTRRRVRYALGYMGLGLFAEARAELKGVAEQEAWLPTVRSAQVDYHIARRQWKKTVAVAALLAGDHPQVENAWIGWAYALRELQRIDEARTVLLEAERHHGKHSAVLHYNLACYDALLGALASARARLERACRLDPGFKAVAQNDPDLQALRAAGGRA